MKDYIGFDSSLVESTNKEEHIGFEIRDETVDGQNPDEEKTTARATQSMDSRLSPSLEGTLKLESNILPKYLEYTFLEEWLKPPVIIPANLLIEHKGKLLGVLKKHKRAIAWKISDIKRISPSFCTHKILIRMVTNHLPYHNGD